MAKVKKTKTRKFLNRGRSLEHFESSESELEDIYGRGLPPNKPPRRKNRNKNTSSGSDLDSSQPKLKGILKKQSSVESNDATKTRRLSMRRGSSVDSALPPLSHFSGKVTTGYLNLF